MSLYNHCSSPGYRKCEVPQIVFPSSHENEFKNSNPTRPSILQTISGNSGLSASTAATSVSSLSIFEIKDSIEDAMSTALFGEDFNPKSPQLSITNHHLSPVHPNPWSDDELLNNTLENHSLPLPPRPIQQATTTITTTITNKFTTKRIVKFSLGSEAWETDSEEQTPDKRSPTMKQNDRSKKQNGRCKNGKGRKGKTEEVEDIEESPEPDPETERMRNIIFKKGAGQGTCGLGIEGLKDMQNIQGPHHKGGYFKGMRGPGK